MPKPFQHSPCLFLVAGLALTLGAAMRADAQWVAGTSITDASFRGMSVVRPGSVWISGTHGTFAWTDDAGTTWHAGRVSEAGSMDFRAVHAISADTVLLEVSGQDTARIYGTTDRGSTWTLRYHDESKGAFLDAMAFFDSRHGLAVGDPVDGHFVLLETRDGGASWSRATAVTPPALAGEGAFAASGTAMIACGPRDAWFATGGSSVSRVFHTSDAGHSWSVAQTPVHAGSAPAGIFSIACSDARHLIVVGGNYAKPDATTVTVARSDDAGTTWVASLPSPATSFLSGVAYVGGTGADRRLVAVGTEGSAYSLDAGRTWSRLDTLSLNVIMSDVHGAAMAAGAGGRVARLAGLNPM